MVTSQPIIVVVVVVAGSWWLQLMVVVMVNRVWEQFGLVSGDVASAELHWYLWLLFAYQSSTYG